MGKWAPRKLPIAVGLHGRGLRLDHDGFFYIDMMGTSIALTKESVLKITDYSQPAAWAAPLLGPALTKQRELIELWRQVAILNYLKEIQYTQGDMTVVWWEWPK